MSEMTPLSQEKDKNLLRPFFDIFMTKILARIFFTQLLNNLMIWALSESFVTLIQTVFFVAFQKKEYVGSIFSHTF